jgi:hypothetical protein
VPVTAFYSIDQEQLDRRYWELADSLASMHDLAASGTPGVCRITRADLMLALEAWNYLDDMPQLERHKSALARIIDAVGA